MNRLKKQRVLSLAALLSLFLVQLLVLPQCLAADATPVMPASELVQRIKDGSAPFILDVRSEREFASSHIPGAVNIPHVDIKDRLSEILAFKEKEVVVHCESGVRAGIAEAVLHGAGFKRVVHLEGDMRAWRRNGHPTESSDQKE